MLSQFHFSAALLVCLAISFLLAQFVDWEDRAVWDFNGTVLELTKIAATQNIGTLVKAGGKLDEKQI